MNINPNIIIFLFWWNKRRRLYISITKLQHYIHFLKNIIKIFVFNFLKYEEHETYKIKNTIYSLFNYLTKEQEEYIDKLCSQLQEFKNEFFYKIYYYLEDNNYYELGNNQQKNILMELNNLRKNSKIKFKQINDNLSIHFENNFQNLIDFIQNSKIDNALNQIIIIDNIKNEIKNLMKELEFIQNHHYSNCSNIIKLQNKTKFHKNHLNKK